MKTAMLRSTGYGRVAGVPVVLIALAAAALCPGRLAAQSPQELIRTASTKPDNCLTCHRAVEEASAMKYTTDVHYARGISCAGCHGGDPTTDDQELGMSPDRGFLGVPKGDDISRTCQRCHSDAQVMKDGFASAVATGQAEALAASVHGKAAVSGEGRMAQCITCHGVHEIKRVDDPRSPVHPSRVNATCAQCHSSAVFMRAYNPGLPIDQEEKYKTSVHGMRLAKGDAKVAVCSSCHGSHDIQGSVDAKSRVNAANIPETCGHCHANAEYMKEYAIPTDQLEQFRTSVHGQALLVKHDFGAPSCNDCHGNHGAAPPDVESISKVCGTCHAMNASLFAESPHKKAFDDLQLPECETCHGNHAIVNAPDALLGVTEEAVCSRCHSSTDNEKGYAVAAAMRALIDTLESGERHADSLVNEAEQKGMEISEAKFKLRDVRQARLQSRTMVHAFNQTRFEEVVKGGIARAGVVAGEGQASIDEYYFRRYGLGVATLIITVVAIALWLTIKRIERRQAGQA